MTRSKLPRRLPPGTYTARVVDVRVRKVRNKPYRKMTVELQVLLPKEHEGKEVRSDIGIGGTQ